MCIRDSARVVSDKSGSDEVGLNDTVTLYFEDDDEEEVYRLVTSIRGNSLKGLINIESVSYTHLDVYKRQAG